MKNIAVGMLSVELGAKLVALGVPENCRRIVIDIKAQDVVTIYFETFAEEPTLEAVLDCLLEIKGKETVPE